MRKYFLLVIACVFATAGFAAKKKKTQAKKSSSIKSVVLHHPACYGKCPVYSLELFNDGKLLYNGELFVEKKGKAQFKVNATKAASLFKLMADSKIDTCSKSYERRIQDIAGFYLIVNYKDSVKRIYNADMGPEFLHELSAGIDSLYQSVKKK